MSNLERAIHVVEQRCLDQGLRLTHKRKNVLSGLLKSHRALSAYELADVYQTEFGETLPTMSIYRILAFLVEKNFVHKLALANKYVACEHICCHHDHGVPQFLICQNCNKVKEISINRSTIDYLQNSAQDVGFRLVSPQLEMSCLCEACVSETA